MCPGGPMTLRRYGELGGRVRDAGSDPPRASIGGGAGAPSIAAASAFWFPTSRATEHRSALRDEVMPCRLWAMKSRRVVGA